MRTTLRAGLATGFAMVALAACNKGDNAARTDSGAASGTVAATDSAAKHDSGAMARTDSTHTANAPGGWTPAATLGFATVASMGEVEEGQMAQKKATSSAIKAFARQMVADHQAMMAAGKTYASAHNVTPDTTTGAAHDLLNDGRGEMKDLTDKAAGADWDKTYLDKQIDDHKKVLDKLQDAAKNTTDADLKSMLEKATGKVQEHLTKAQDLRKTLK